MRYTIVLRGDRAPGENGPREIRPRGSHRQARRGIGETAAAFRAKGVEAADLVAAACFEPHELKARPRRRRIVRAACLSLGEAGFDASELRGCSDADEGWLRFR